MDLFDTNRRAWDKKVEDGAVYTKPIIKELIEKSKIGEWETTVTSLNKSRCVL